ncbi:DUF2634 domain-containing protein [Paenibacillus sp. ATY16]|uniref:DUF2634 domain-containing protein n=1 Tax=Paenibacillus sp. ATY16 TaxID=1759312 RepID=UPI00200C2AA6|nr:DUF2634 domain-containing protein [Paenibacillus sp. ATY16]MCK9862033.1 DUF2634 domain-containing protein [Paenibacillus sp. ATY16]
MILPEGAVLNTASEEVEQTSRTYRLDIERGKITGFVDGQDAVKQAIYKILDTERFAHFIYSGNYGSEKSGIFRTDYERWIRDALLQDERISAVQDFEISGSGDEVAVRFTALTIYGSVAIEKGGF